MKELDVSAECPEGDGDLHSAAGIFRWAAIGWVVIGLVAWWVWG